MDVIGGGVLVAAAAGLWIAYLLPSWLRRRQYLDTERNAVRLQQTLRILAETAETPEAVRVEATAREVAIQQRILHEHEETARLEAEAAEHLAIAERLAAEEAAAAARELASAVQASVTEPITIVTARAPESSHTTGTMRGATSATATDAARRRRALRRRRGLSSLLLLASLLVVVGGLIATAFGSPLLVAGIGAAGMVLALGLLVRLARVRVPAAAAAPVALPESVPFEPIELAEPEVADHGWVPQPLPKPLHLSRGTIAAMAMASVEAAAELKRVAADAEVARRVEKLEPTVPSIVPPAVAASGRPTVPAASARDRGEAASPYARMGIVDDAAPGFEDLDAVLRRRRQAG
jgi:hypothetical protein